MKRYRFLGGAYHSDMRLTAGQKLVALPAKSPASAQARNASTALTYEKCTVRWENDRGQKMRSEVYVDRSITAEQQKQLLTEYFDLLGA